MRHSATLCLAALLAAAPGVGAPFVEDPGVPTVPPESEKKSTAEQLESGRVMHEEEEEDVEKKNVNTELHQKDNAKQEENAKQKEQEGLQKNAPPEERSPEESATIDEALQKEKQNVDKELNQKDVKKELHQKDNAKQEENAKQKEQEGLQKNAPPEERSPEESATIDEALQKEKQSDSVARVGMVVSRGSLGEERDSSDDVEAT